MESSSSSPPTPPMRQAHPRECKDRADKEPSIVIGIDFGTTYSGVAWARSSKPEQINVVSSWKTQLYSNSDKEKSPSSFAYRENSPSSWGYDIGANDAPLNWFKLSLLDEEDLPRHIRDSEQMKSAQSLLKQSNKHAVEVIGDYLRELWEHSLESIERATGNEMVQISKFLVVVTLPAIWPTYAQVRMREAIEKAGILDLRSAGDTVLSFVSEPEAAALCVMEDMKGRADIKPNDHFVVCDAGGGTVDLITYMVLSNQPMTIRESVKGTGKLCGAVFLDERFLQLLQSKIPHETWSRLGDNGLRRLLNDHWENGIKTQFCNDEMIWKIQLPFCGTNQGRFHQTDIVLHRAQIFDVFKPVMNDIVQLVLEQVNQVKKKYGKPPKFIILVGGFGRSQFLHTCIYQGMRKKIEVLQSTGPRPWTAVCRGAVIKGLVQGNHGASVIVHSRIARASYGTTYNEVPWDEKEHDIRDKAWCPIQQEFLAVDQTKWFVHINEAVSTDDPIRHTFWQDLEYPEEEIVTELIYSLAFTPPMRCDESVKDYCRIRWSKIPNFHELPEWKNKKGQSFRQICYEIRMITDGVSLDFQIFHNRTMVASKNVAVDFHGGGVSNRREVD